MAVSLRLKRAKRWLKRLIVAGHTRSAPLLIASTYARSSPAISSSEVLRAAKSKPKLGAQEYDRPLLASNCIQRAGRCRNAVGVMNTIGVPENIGLKIMKNNPMS